MIHTHTHYGLLYTYKIWLFVFLVQPSFLAEVCRPLCHMQWKMYYIEVKFSNENDWNETWLFYKVCVHICFIFTGGNSCLVMRGERSELGLQKMGNQIIRCIYDRTELHRCRYYNNLSLNSHLVPDFLLCGADWKRMCWKTGRSRSKSVAVFMWNLKGTEAITNLCMAYVAIRKI